MSNWAIAILSSLSAGVWVYGKFMRSTGNNTRNSVIGAIITGLLVLGLVLIALNLLFK